MIALSTSSSTGESTAASASDGAKHARTRVLHVIQNLNYGGMERVLADIVRGVDKTHFEMHVLAIEYLGRFAEGLDTEAELHLGGAQARWSMLHPRGLAAQIRRIAPHSVHTHSGVWYKASLAARLAGVPKLIHTEHGRRHPDPFIDRTVDSLAARRTDVVVAVSESLRAQLTSSGIASPERIRVVPNGIDTNVYTPRTRDGRLHRELGLPPDVPILGSVGRLEPIKGYDIMVEAFARLCAHWADGPAPVLVVAGEGSERRHLEELIASRGLGSSVHLLGWRDDIATFHAGFALFTLSSRSEGTSISLLEAMSAGLCPVVTDVGGNRAVLGESLAHRLVPPNDVGSLAAAWRNALRDPQLVNDGERSRARVEERFGVRAMVSRYESLYAGGV